MTKNKLNQFSIPVQSSEGGRPPSTAQIYEFTMEEPRDQVKDLFDNREETIRNGVPGPS